MEGWVSLHRKFIEWEWFSDNNMVKLFIYLLLSANHTNGTWKGVTVKRGQFVTGLDALKLKTNISIQSLRTCLTRLEKTQEINMKTTNKYRIITICNYDSYQNEKTKTNKQTNKQLTNKQQTTNKQLTANNNDNKNNNENNDNNYKTTLLSDLNKSDFDNPEYFEITIAFYELFKKNLIEAGASTTQIEKANGKWIDHIRLLIEKDNENKDSVRTVFTYMQTASFWKKNILSTEKLREQFGRLLIEINDKKNEGSAKIKHRQPATSDEELANIIANAFAKKAG